MQSSQKLPIQLKNNKIVNWSFYFIVFHLLVVIANLITPWDPLILYGMGIVVNELPIFVFKFNFTSIFLWLVTFDIYNQINYHEIYILSICQ
jgi:hypothetical protein